RMTRRTGAAAGRDRGHGSPPGPTSTTNPQTTKHQLRPDAVKPGSSAFASASWRSETPDPARSADVSAETSCADYASRLGETVAMMVARSAVVLAGHDQARFISGDHGLGPVAQAELGQDAADVRLHRFLGDDEAARDLRVGHPFGDQPQHLGF